MCCFSNRTMQNHFTQFLLVISSSWNTNLAMAPTHGESLAKQLNRYYEEWYRLLNLPYFTQSISTTSILPYLLIATVSLTAAVIVTPRRSWRRLRSDDRRRLHGRLACKDAPFLEKNPTAKTQLFRLYYFKYNNDECCTHSSQPLTSYCTWRTSSHAAPISRVSHWLQIHWLR